MTAVVVFGSGGGIWIRIGGGIWIRIGGLNFGLKTARGSPDSFF